MFASKAKRNLFGGALRHAGLATAAVITSTAMADFVPAAPPPSLSYNFLQVYATNSGGGFVNNFVNVTTPVFNPTQSYFGPGLVMVAYANSTAIGASITVTDAGIWDQNSVVAAIQWVTVTDSKSVLIEWDLSGATNAVEYVYQLGYGVITPIGMQGSTGSSVLTLLPGQTYAFTCQIEMVGATGGGFVRFVNVPTPGALGLLGMGMLAARKRRRR